MPGVKKRNLPLVGLSQENRKESRVNFDFLKYIHVIIKCIHEISFNQLCAGLQAIHRKVLVLFCFKMDQFLNQSTVHSLEN